MKKRYFVYLLVSLFLLPTFVFASEVDVDEGFYIVSETTKYYKTETDLSNSRSRNSSVTYEITKKEYDSADISNLRSNPTTHETTYKRMTSYILTNGSYYRYKNVLSWKNMPSTRSYDIIGIGFLGSVKVLNNTTYFNEYYCYSDGSGCYSTTTNYPQIFTYGAGTSFQLPSGDLSTLKQTFYFDVTKNITNTITVQHAYADYAHATSTISQANSKKYTVDQNIAIVLNNSISSYYDSMSIADAGWSGTW